MKPQPSPPHGVELRAVKHAGFASQETACFSATVYIAGKKGGIVENQGQGGPNLYTPFSLQEKLGAIAKTQPDLELDFGGKKTTMKQDADTFIGELLDDILEARSLKRHCARKTLFRLKSETYARGEWRTVKAKFSPVVKEHLTKKYAADLAEILNETLV